MGKSTNGPDWTDWETFARLIEAASGAKVGVLLSPDGPGFCGGMTVTVLAQLPRVDGSDVERAVEVNCSWPCAEGHDLAAHCFEGLYKIDAELERELGDDYLKTRA